MARRSLAAFQTLIGTVKRGLARRTGGAPLRLFQTLIGTVKREALLRSPLRRPGGFQTLIGTVKRGYPYLGSGGGYPVSNPHRYGQKPGVGHLNYHHEDLVSNPHRYGQKPFDNPPSTSIETLFQTLIGTVKSRPLGVGWRPQWGFQTLIGTVKSSSRRGRPTMSAARFKPS